MRIIKLSTTILSIGLFLMGCNTNQPPQTANIAPMPPDGTTAEALTEGEYWAKDNLDLPRVGNLLERSNSPEEFESYLNSNDGINNLDLNGDGYVDSRDRECLGPCDDTETPTPDGRAITETGSARRP